VYWPELDVHCGQIKVATTGGRARRWWTRHRERWKRYESAGHGKAVLLDFAVVPNLGFTESGAGATITWSAGAVVVST
jgi:hypothetical protein